MGWAKVHENISKLPKLNERIMSMFICFGIIHQEYGRRSPFNEYIKMCQKKFPISEAHVKCILRRNGYMQAFRGHPKFLTRAS